MFEIKRVDSIFISNSALPVKLLILINKVSQYEDPQKLSGLRAGRLI